MKTDIEEKGAKEEGKVKLNSTARKKSRSRSVSSASSRSKSRKITRKYSRSRSNSSSPSPIRGSRRKRNRSVSRSPSPRYLYRHSSSSTPHIYKNSCLGVFGMSLDTTERTLEREFGKFGKLQKVKVVRNIGTGTSRGFAFVYFEEADDAKTAREEINGGKEIEGHTIRIDYSVGRRERSTGNRGYYGNSYYPSYYDRHERPHDSEYYGYYGHGRNRRSPSPYRRRRSSRHRSRTRSVSPRNY